MATSINKFLTDFQDMYVDRNVVFQNTSDNINRLDLMYLEKYLKGINSELKELNQLTFNASAEALIHYEQVLDNLNKSLDYISDTADVYNYVNSYFDSKTVKDLYNFNLIDSSSNDCIYDLDKKGITLKSVNSLYNCSKNVDGDSITFYNTNNSSHSGMHLYSQYLDILKIKQIVIRKSDGTILELDVRETTENEFYIKHEELISSQIIIKFEVYDQSIPLNTYLNTVNLNLISYEYGIEGSIALNESKLIASDLFTIIPDVVLPSNTYANLNLGIDLLDINGNVLDTIEETLPLNNSLICKRLDRINHNEVGAYSFLIIKNKKTKSKLSKEYLEKLTFPNEKYVLYSPKDLTENILNKYITKLGSNSFRVNNRSVKQINFTPSLELFSFQPGESPIIRHLTGVTKNETI